MQQQQKQHTNANLAQNVSQANKQLNIKNISNRVHKNALRIPSTDHNQNYNQKSKNLTSPVKLINSKSSSRKQLENESSQINLNGFTNTPTAFQILPVIFLLMTTITFLLALFLTLLNHNNTYIGVTCTFLLILYAITIYYWYKTTSIDPTDPVQSYHRAQKQKNQYFDGSKYKYYCRSCETCVGNNSFHCKKCRRCVHLFDHHCRWLNNCIGAANYIEFILLIGVCWVLVGFIIGVGVHLFVIQLERMKNGKQELKWVIVVNTVLSFISLIPFGALSYLCILHIYLFFRNKSTLQLIMQSRKKSRIHPSVTKQIITNNRVIIDKINKKSFEEQTENQGKTPNQLIKTNGEDQSYNFNNEAQNQNNKSKLVEGYSLNYKRLLPSLKIPNSFSKSDKLGASSTYRNYAQKKQSKKTIKNILATQF